jgi:WD40 repeat protein
MVQDVRYAPSGDYFASGGSDMKLFIYDGKTGDTLAEFTENGHKGSIVWSSYSLLTTRMTPYLCSGLVRGALTADYLLLRLVIAPSNFVNIFYLLSVIHLIHLAGDVETRKPVTTWTVGSDINHQQVGNTWSGEKDIVSLSLSGDLNVFDPRIGDGPARVLTVLFIQAISKNFC